MIFENTDNTTGNHFIATFANRILRLTESSLSPLESWYMKAFNALPATLKTALRGFLLPALTPIIANYSKLSRVLSTKSG